MPDPVTAVLGGVGLVGSSQQADATQSAADAQAAASQAGVAEQRRQFDLAQQLAQPYVAAGVQGISGLQGYAPPGAVAYAMQQALAGMLGTEAQTAAIKKIEQGGGFQAAVRSGEEALLQRASATGGLRGGNLQAALAQFRPAMLESAINQQYGRLGGFSDIGRETLTNLSKFGQASAAGQAAQGLTSATNISNLLAAQGQAQSGGIMGQSQAFQQGLGGLGGAALYALNKPAATPPPKPAATPPPSAYSSGWASMGGGVDP